MGVRSKTDKTDKTDRQTVVRCMINPWRQTEDEGQRSVSQAPETGRGDLWLVTSIFIF